MNQLATQDQIQAIERLVIHGDLAKLNSEQKVTYYKYKCDRAGLDWTDQPFDYITLQGKQTLYCKKNGTDQLRRIHHVSINITDRTQIGEVFVVTAKAKTPDGREDESTGAVHIGFLKGEALSNAFMKAETKAKRRVTLSICGLGMLDESEVENLPKSHEPIHNEQKAPIAPIQMVEPPKPLPVIIEPVKTESKRGKSKMEMQAELHKVRSSTTWTADEMQKYMLAAYGTAKTMDLVPEQFKQLEQIMTQTTFAIAMTEFEQAKSETGELFENFQ